jgi:hypothetical protein
MRTKPVKNFSIALGVALVIFFIVLKLQELMERVSLINDGELAKRNDSFIYLLFFNKFQIYDDSWGLGKETSSPEDLAKVNCPHTNCIFTSKKDLLPNVHDFDVVFLTVWWQQVMDVPKTRHPKQFYVLGINE